MTMKLRTVLKLSLVIQDKALSQKLEGFIFVYLHITEWDKLVVSSITESASNYIRCVEQMIKKMVCKIVGIWGSYFVSMNLNLMKDDDNETHNYFENCVS